MAGGRLWTDKEERQLARLYPNNSNKRIAKIFNRTTLSIQKKAQKLGLRKCENYLSQTKKNALSGSNAPNWNGGVKITSKGYRMIHSPDHPNSTKNGYVMEHRLVMEDYLGRFLKDNEIIHHKNENKKDNRIENLVLMKRGQHTALHHLNNTRSEETRNKISRSAKERYKEPENHPSYKNIDPSELLSLRDKGKTIKEICKLKNICKRTFYKKIREYKGELKNAQ